ncbi:MAG: sigma-70 family RNA polymerase sigma factor [Paludibacter sp.]|nr:sigma-70 family RNA polymerase sigma factor [Paludibacter sp.]
METSHYSSEISPLTSDFLITRSYNDFHQFIINYIALKINNRDEAEDLAQDVFVRLLDYKQMLRPETVKSFLFTIAQNIVIDYLRRHYKKQEISANMYEFLEKSTDDIESKLQEQEILHLEKYKLSTFSPKRKIVYSLCRYEEMTVTEISEKLNISRRTVENHLLTGRKIMREFIRECV